MSRAERDCTIANQLGLHLRAAAAFVKVAERFKSDIVLERDTTRANGKSIIALVTLAAPVGTDVRVSADGIDADEAVSALAQLIADRFGEGA
jgi:phosphocarrier protein HPr